MTDQELLTGLREASSGFAALDAAELARVGRREHNRRVGIAAGASTLALAVGLGAGLLALPTQVATPEPAQTQPAQTQAPAWSVGTWEAVAAPLAQQDGGIGDLVYVDGTYLLLGDDGCADPTREETCDFKTTLAGFDGSVWTKLADPPADNLRFTANAVISDKLFYAGLAGAEQIFWSYDLSDNAWTELPLPPIEFDFEFGTTQLLAAGENLYLYTPTSDYLYDGAWTKLPENPLLPEITVIEGMPQAVYSYREAAWNGSEIVVFSKQPYERAITDAEIDEITSSGPVSPETEAKAGNLKDATITGFSALGFTAYNPATGTWRTLQTALPDAELALFPNLLVRAGTTAQAELYRLDADNLVPLGAQWPAVAPFDYNGSIITATFAEAEGNLLTADGQALALPALPGTGMAAATAAGPDSVLAVRGGEAFRLTLR
ncbi:MAG: hypothetical protein LBR58_10570 [Propionibacteriaceae bacterium]|jgi:hypothetical protein|nr:hypothetical protein [Propionibacteriaceae bacterium]